jgi:anti-sigma B factor antagonist
MLRAHDRLRFESRKEPYSARPTPEVTVANFKVETDQKAGELLVRLYGEFDILAFGEVDQLLTGAQSEGDRRVVVDLRTVEFIDSSGIRALVRAHKRAADTGGAFRLIRGPKTVHRVFEVAGLDTRLDFGDATSA